MPMFLHQWRYKDDMVKPMLVEKTERVHVVRTAVEAFGGSLQQFFFCLGEFDGVAVSEFPDDESALACLMAMYTEGRVHDIKSTKLYDAQGIARAKAMAAEVLGLPKGV